MADDLSLLFRIRGDSSGAKAAAADARQAITQLKNSATSDLKAIQSASTFSLGSITQTAGQISQSIPVVGRAVNSLSNSFTSLTDASTGAATGIASMAGPLSIAVAGIIATTAAVAKLGSELFDLTKQTAEFQGKLFDLSQQTGVSVETLSALEVVARTTGGSIESITASLGIFQKNLEESLDTSSKAAKAFDRLGVEVSDTEQTFRDTLAALAKMPEGFRQTALALELFGRGGKQVLAILKETQGDLDGTIEKLRGMGLVTTQQARTADEFNDKLVLLEVSLRGLGTQAIPLVIDVLNDLQKAIAQNKDAFEALRLGISAVTFLFTGPLKGAIFVATGLWASHRGEVQLLAEAYQILQTAIHGAVAEIPKQPTPPAGQTEGLRLLKELQAFGAGHQFTPQQDLSQIKGLFKEVPKKGGAAAGLDPGVQLLQQLQKELRGLEQQTRAEEIAAELLDTRFKGVNEKVKEQILLAARIIDRKREQIEVDREATELSERLERERKAAAESLSQFLQQQAEDLQRVEGITKTAFDDVEDFVDELGLLGQTLDNNQLFWLKFNAAMIEAARHAKELKDILPELLLPKLEFLPKEGEILPGVPVPPVPVFKPHFDAINALKDTYLDLADGIAHGTAAMIEQWVLLGTAGPNAIRKMTAQVLAGLAAQAAAKAIFELAEGFAALAGFLPGPAALHFKAAAFYGATAAAAGVAGRAIAGDLFQQKSGGAGGTAGGSSQLNPLTLNRNQPAPTRTIVLQIQSNDSHIVKVVGADIREAGPLRELILNDGGA